MSDQQMTLSIAQLIGLGENIGEIDVVLDSLSGAQSAGKRAVINRLVKEVQPRVDEVLGQLDYQVLNPVETDDDGNPVLDEEGNPVVKELSDDEFVGIFAGIVKGLESKYTERQNKIMESKVEEIKAETPNLSEEEVKELTDKRKLLVMQFKATKEIFKTFGMPGVDEVPDPKRRTGSIGKRGPRAISAFRWSVDGVAQAPEKDSLAGVAGDNDYDSAKELRDAMRKAKIDLKNPPDHIEFTLANGKKLVGTKPEEPEEDDDSDLDDDDEDEEETENVAS